jgi:hypothetical protein
LNAPRDSYPSDTKFFEKKPTIKKVVDSVLFAQKLVLQLIAELRYSIAMSSKLQSRDWLASVKNFPFFEELDHSWLIDLCYSKAMTTQRLAGTVAFADVVEKGYTLHRFAHFDAPVL